MNARTIKTIRAFSGLIAAIGAIVSYKTQVDLLAGWGVDELAAHAIPLTVDLLAIICALVIHTPDVDPAGRTVAYRVLVMTGVVSITANALAGQTVGGRIAHVWCVLAYLAAEAIAAKVKAKTTVDPQLQAARDELAAAQAALTEATAALAEAQAGAEQARTDAAREVRAAKTAARKAIREAKAATETAPQPVPAAPTAPARKLWIPTSPADLESAFALPAPVSPAPAGA